MNSLKKGDKVVCISLPNRKLDFDKNTLTLYKTYIISNVTYNTLIIINDDCHLCQYYKYRFITLKEFRLLKLKQIYEHV